MVKRSSDESVYVNGRLLVLDRQFPKVPRIFRRGMRTKGLGRVPANTEQCKLTDERIRAPVNAVQMVC